MSAKMALTLIYSRGRALRAPEEPNPTAPGCPRAQRDQRGTWQQFPLRGCTEFPLRGMWVPSRNWVFAPPSTAVKDGGAGEREAFR
jgi:hypothetical protein